MEYRVSTEQSEMDFEVIHGFISKSYWAQEYPRRCCVQRLVTVYALGSLIRIISKWPLAA